MLTRSLSLSILIGGALGAGATPAYAYLDPGTGSMILQVLLGGIAGVAVAGRFYWRKVLGFLGMDSAPAAAPGLGDKPTFDSPETRSDK
jgi:hypothetical protein